MANHELTPIETAVEILEDRRVKEMAFVKRVVEIQNMQDQLFKNAIEIVVNYGVMKSKPARVAFGPAIYASKTERIEFLATQPIDFEGKIKGQISLEEERTPSNTYPKDIKILWQGETEVNPTTLFFLNQGGPIFGPDNQQLEGNDQFNLLHALLEQIKTAYGALANQEKTADTQEQISKPTIPTTIRLPKKRIRFPNNDTFFLKDDHVV